MNSFEKQLDQYADLAVRIGANIQPGQTLVVTALTSAADFVRRVTKKAYEAGAKNVHVEWSDEQVTRTKYEMAPEQALREYPTWRAQGLETFAKEGAAFLYIDGSNPDYLKGIDPERISIARQAQSSATRAYREYLSNSTVSWSIVAVPTIEWANKVYPDVPEAHRVARLWETIFKTTRIDLENPVGAWSEHITKLDRRADYLNQKRYKKLHYVATGTDLTIELPKGHIWKSGATKNAEGVNYVANMPTEECFTMPLKTGVNGVVRSTMPLSYSGQMIENFSLTFENGKIVDFKTEVDGEALAKLLDTDEGARFLGEVALVPYDSPISNMNVIFHNTLFDENASCHLAIGDAYPFCLEGGTNMNHDELKKAGANVSLTHVDFMMGAKDMNIDGVTEDGQVEAVFRNGNWAF